MIGIIVLLLFIIIIQYITMVKILDLEDELEYYNRHLNQVRKELRHDRKKKID